MHAERDAARKAGRRSRTTPQDEWESQAYSRTALLEETRFAPMRDVRRGAPLRRRCFFHVILNGSKGAGKSMVASQKAWAGGREESIGESATKMHRWKKLKGCRLAASTNVALRGLASLPIAHRSIRFATRCRVKLASLSVVSPTPVRRRDIISTFCDLAWRKCREIQPLQRSLRRADSSRGVFTRG